AWAGALAGTKLVPEVVDSQSTVGGGSLPGETLPTRALAVRPSPDWQNAPSLDDLAARLRRWRQPVVGRIERDRLLLDPRTVLPSQDEMIATALRLAVER
ncbi:MAG: L-seryl-tRNA(Sec) selenium transferase, partial [Chloroflexota bacterium]